MKIAILGAGAWGTALGIALSPRHEITLWCRDPQQSGQLAAARVNARYLPGVAIPGAVRITADADAALKKHRGKRMPVADIAAMIRCILDLSPAACVKEIAMPALKDEDV